VTLPLLCWSNMVFVHRPIDSMYSSDLRDMVTMLLRPNPDDRPTAEDIEGMPVVRVRLGAVAP
jgi:hypothetical protein